MEAYYIAGIVLCALSIFAMLGAIYIIHLEHKALIELMKDTTEQANSLIANAIEKERITLEEYRESIDKPAEGIPPEFNNIDKPEYENGFNPHSYTSVDDE